MVGVVVDLGAGDDGHPLVEQPDEGADHPGLRLTALAQQDDVVTGQDGVLQLGHDGLLEAEHAGDERLVRRRSALAVLRRISSATGTDSQPEARRSARDRGRSAGGLSVAGRGVAEGSKC